MGLIVFILSANNESRFCIYLLSVVKYQKNKYVKSIKGKKKALANHTKRYY